MNRRGRGAAVAVGLGLVALVAAACGGGPSSSSATTASTTPPTTSTPTTSGSRPSTPTTGARTTTTGAAGTTTCTSPALQVHVLSSPAGAGHEGVVLGFTNQGSATCTLSGYPGVALLDASGAQAAQATRTPNGYLGGLRQGQAVPVVTLTKGATASATVEGSDVASGSATNCPTYPALLVTPPNLRQSVKLTASVPGCTAVQVHPVVPGTSGTTGG